MIGGLLRFAPGRLGARKDRAPRGCRTRWWGASWLPCVTSETSWNLETRDDAGGLACCLAGMATGSAIGTRCVSRGWLRMDGRRDRRGRLILACGCSSAAGSSGGGKLARLFGQPQVLLWELGRFG